MVSLKKPLLERLFRHNEPYAFNNDEKSKHIKLIHHKFTAGVYALETHPCDNCGANKFFCISQTDCYGLPASSVLCKRCGLLAINPRLNEKGRNDFFLNHYFGLLHGGKTAKEVFDEIHDKKGVLLVNFITDNGLARPGDFVLDIGCGFGGVVAALKNRGFSVVGIDTYQPAVDYGISCGLPLMHGSIHSLNKESVAPASVIVYSYCLEYLDEIEQELREAASFLSHNGAIVILGIKLKKPLLSGIRLNYSIRFYFRHILTESTLSAIAAKAGLRIDRIPKEKGSGLFQAKNHSIYVLRKIGTIALPIKERRHFAYGILAHLVIAELMTQFLRKLVRLKRLLPMKNAIRRSK